MFRLALGMSWARKRRLLATSAAVVLGIAFLVATLVLGDTARAGFRAAFEQANAGTDVLVRSATQFTSGETQTVSGIDSNIVAEISDIDSVADVHPVIDGYVQILNAKGEPMGGQGPPTIGGNWQPDPKVNPFRIINGTAPATPEQVVIDEATYKASGHHIGDTITVLTPDRTEVALVGVLTANVDTGGGVTITMFSTAGAQKHLMRGEDQLTGVIVNHDGTISDNDLRDRLNQTLPEQYEALTGTELTDEQQEQIQGDFLGYLTIGLLVFAGIALLVAAFTIFNTFTILAAQRTRESALLRTLGASRAQVLHAGMSEALIVGLVGSAAGILVGWALSYGLEIVLNSAVGLPTNGAQLSGMTLLVATGTGVAMTVAGGFVPAYKAARVAPLAALRDVNIDRSHLSKGRLTAGIIGAVTGIGLVLSSGGGELVLQRTGAGAVITLLSVVLLGPVVARPATGAIGAPLHLRGVIGDLARRNAMRNPRRTSATAAALLIGVGVVSLFTTFASSIGATIGDSVERNFGGDLVVSAGGFSGVGLAPALVDGLGTHDKIAGAAGFGFGSIAINGEETQVGFTDLSEFTNTITFEITEGHIGDGLLVSESVLKKNRWTVGQAHEITYADGATETLTIDAVFKLRDLGGDVMMNTANYIAHNPQAGYFLGIIDLADGVSIDEGRKLLEEQAAPYGNPKIEDKDQFIESQVGQINQMLGIVYGLLGLAILIALLGISNTLSLSVFERTRELGLLRAVGNDRGQTRAMIRWESILIASFGSVGGVGLGAFLGWGLMRALSASQDFGVFALPGGQLLVIGLVGGIAGVFAGMLPAWRAGRLNVLDAIAQD